MADEQDKWLDRETAEFLLRGEPLEGADPAVRDRAERLVAALGALAPPVPAGEELQAAALAAFRKYEPSRPTRRPGSRPPSGTVPRTGSPAPVPSASARAARAPGGRAGAARCASGWPPR
ncbi:hypothetical protein ACRAS7_00015 [Streptomyces lividans]